MAGSHANTSAAAGQLMAGKRGLIMGVANNRSIAWGIAKAVAAQGAELAFTYQGDALKKRVEPLAAELGAQDCPALRRDRRRPSMDECLPTLGKAWGRLDFLVHAIAFSDKDELDGRYVDTTREELHADACSSPATRSPRSPSAPRS